MATLIPTLTRPNLRGLYVEFRHAVDMRDRDFDAGRHGPWDDRAQKLGERIKAEVERLTGLTVDQISEI